VYSTHRDASTDIFQYDITLGKPNETQFALCETLFAFTENLQFCSYLVHARNPSIVILRRLDQCKKSTGNLLNVSWKSPGNLLGWICRHPVIISFSICMLSAEKVTVQRKVSTETE